MGERFNMLSVCMATYNGEKYIQQQLDSILACLSANDELIVSDDGSTDGTIAILESYARNNADQIHIISGPQRGVIANFNNALKHAKGDYIFLSDQDDIWKKDKVEKVISAFNEHDCTVVVHDARIVDAQCNPIGQTLFEYRQSGPGFFKNVIKNSYVGCCMAIRRDLLSAILPLPENVEMHDWWIGLISELRGRSIFIDDKLIDYRRHGDNASSMNHYPIQKMLAIRFVLLAQLAKRGWALMDGDC